MSLSPPLLLLALSSVLLQATDIRPATAAAFERYAKLTEEEIQRPSGPHDFLWVDRHSKEQSLVWLGQPVIAPEKTLDQGREIEVPDASLQHWVGTILLEYATLERVRDLVLDFANYKQYFKQFFIDSRLVKRDGDRFDGFLRLSRKQFSTLVLNINVTASYTSLDPARAYIIARSTHIGEVEHPRQKKSYDQERPAADAYGYLWRHNVYWKIEQTGDGVFVEVQSLTLSRPAGGLSPGRFLNSFVQNFPREFVDGLLDSLRQAFPRPAK